MGVVFESHLFRCAGLRADLQVRVLENNGPVDIAIARVSRDDLIEERREFIFVVICQLIGLQGDTE